MLLDGTQQIAAPREHLVRIGLMADIPDQAIVRGIENVVRLTVTMRYLRSSSATAAKSDRASARKSAGVSIFESKGKS
jgi:hypothetical protein